MTRLVASLAEIAGPYEALFCDLWGCVHDGVRAFPAAVAALQAWRQSGRVVILLTNSPRPRAGVQQQLRQLGVPDDAWDDIVTSGDAAQWAMANGAVGHKVWHIGPERDLPFFTDLPPEAPATAIERVPQPAAEGIVCTGLDDEYNESPEDYRGRLLLAREARLVMLCANPDIVVDRGDRRLWCAGALAQLYEEMGGRTLYFGKPHPPIYDLARRRLAALGHEVAEGRILCTGDGIGTDIAGAAGEGLDALFITGGLAAAAFGPDRDAPDPARLRDWLDQQQQAPEWAIGMLR